MIPWLLFAGSVLAAVLSVSCSLVAGLRPLIEMRRWERDSMLCLVFSILFGIALCHE